MPENSFTGEACSFQRALFIDVLDVGSGPDPLHEGGSKQILGKGPLGRRAVAAFAAAR
jgi:hypothetical protein